AQSTRLLHTWAWWCRQNHRRDLHHRLLLNSQRAQQARSSPTAAPFNPPTPTTTITVWRAPILQHDAPPRARTAPPPSRARGTSHHHHLPTRRRRRLSAEKAHSLAVAGAPIFSSSCGERQLFHTTHLHALLPFRRLAPFRVPYAVVEIKPSKYINRDTNLNTNDNLCWSHDERPSIMRRHELDKILDYYKDQVNANGL
ncbi:uncharacterized protein BKA78DRAFT_360202, partial [Phyllosticta capitalensis]|uniref:uncharacterized protein n=1 Tax=Phyllosticta capitalensis TaxID=121624 RepID=UPI00313094BF